MGHLYQLPLNVLGDWRDSLVRQLQAYELVVASVNKYYKDNGALGRANRAQRCRTQPSSPEQRRTAGGASGCRRTRSAGSPSAGTLRTAPR